MFIILLNRFRNRFLNALYPGVIGEIPGVIGDIPGVAGEGVFLGAFRGQLPRGVFILVNK